MDKIYTWEECRTFIALHREGSKGPDGFFLDPSRNLFLWVVTCKPTRNAYVVYLLSSLSRSPARGLEGIPLTYAVVPLDREFENLGPRSDWESDLTFGVSSNLGYQQTIVLCQGRDGTLDGYHDGSLSHGMAAVDEPSITKAVVRLVESWHLLGMDHFRKMHKALLAEVYA